MKLVIFDKDGTLTTTKSGNTFAQSPQDQELITGVAKRLEQLRRDGWKIAIASNQGGVDAGYKSLDDAVEEMRVCLSLTKIEIAYFCPSYFGGWWRSLLHKVGFLHTRCYEVTQDSVQEFPEYYCDEGMVLYTGARWGRHLSYRKPGGLMLFLACLHSFPGCFPDRVIYVGDRGEDEMAAADAQISFQWAHSWRALGI